MSKRYSHLLSPLKIGNVVLKNRTCFPNASPHFLQGPETFPAEPFIAFYTNLAKNGAAYIDLAEWDNPNQRKFGAADGLRMQSFDLTDPSTHNYFSAMADDIHFYGSKLCVSVMLPSMPDGYSFSGGMPIFSLPGVPVKPTKMLPEEMFGEVIDTFIEKLKVYKTCGYDMVSIGLGMFLSPFFNRRKDEFGGTGSIENRARFPFMICKAVKKAFGQDFLIESVIAGEMESGYTTDDVVAVAKLAEGKIDIFSLREKDVTKNHPTGFTFREGEHKCIEYSEAIKKSGAKVAVAVNGGFQDLDEIEGYLAAGKCDLICMARAFFADPEYIKKAKEERGEDVTPCLWCNKCHGTMDGPWISICSVNPLMGIEHKIGRMVEAPGKSKKVAVIGGGPAGMEAAIVAAKRGHHVTLYEKDGLLGGQLLHSDYASFKWPIRKFKNYLISQLYKTGVNVLLNTAPTPEMIKAGSFDAVVAALGAESNIPDIPGIKAPDGSLAAGLWTCIDVFGREKELGRNVIIVGGSETGVETGMYLAENGHNVTVLTRQEELATDAPKLHYITMAHVEFDKDGRETIKAAWEILDNFKGITRATTTAVSDGKVTYADADGKKHILKTDSIVICGGMNPRQNEALKFTGVADNFFITGDCEVVSNIQRCMRSAYSKATQI